VTVFHSPGEASKDVVDAVIVALMSAEDPEPYHAALVRNNRESTSGRPEPLSQPCRSPQT